MAILELADFTVFVEGLDHPECVAWGPDGLLYAGGEAGQVYRMTADGEQLTEIGSTGGFLLGICLDADATVYACDAAKPAVVRMTQTGQVDVYSSGGPDRGFVNPNYPVFDRSGNLYVSDSGTFHGDDGCTWVIRPGGATELVDETLSQFPNGIALDAAEEYLYVALSTLPGVARIPVRDGREVGRPEPVVTLERAVPDGLAFDADGNLYIACYSPDVIYRLGPGGKLDTLAEDWERVTLASPTNLAFGGSERTTMFVASLCRWHLAKTELGVAGQPVNYPQFARS